MVTENSMASARSSFVRDLMKFLARTSPSKVLPIQLPNGERPVVPALGSDRVSEVAMKVARSGAANVCVLYKETRMMVLGFEDAPHDNSHGENPLQDIHADITMDMLIDSALSLHGPNNPMPIRIDFGGTSATVPTVKELVNQ